MSTKLVTLAQVTVGTTPVLVFSAPLDYVQTVEFGCPSTNAGSVFIGDSSVAGDESRGHKIIANGTFVIDGRNARGGGSEFLDLQHVYAVASAASQKLNIVMLVKLSG